jgi:nitric oxide reductase NorD protein
MLSPSDPHLSVQDPMTSGRPIDRADEELDALGDELGGLRELPTVHSDDPTREILASEDAPRRSGGGDAGATESLALRYPEWDHRLRGYRPGACVLREVPAPPGDPAWAARARTEHRALLLHLRRQFEALRPRRVRLHRQLEGDDLDPDGWVEELAEQRAGGAPPGRLYARERPHRRDVAAALLVDASGSTDAWVSGTRRVIDVAREAALCLCEALSALGDRHAVYAFSGRGAADVRVWCARTFDEAREVGPRLSGLEPDAFTRLGAPLRHVTAQLSREPARVRLLLLLSDGKPNDEDAYDGDYGVEDVRQAVAEARAAQVRVFCAAIDRNPGPWLPRMFGPHGYTVIRDLAHLPRQLPDLYRRFAGGRAP